MSTTLKFKTTNKTIEITNNREAIKNLASLKIGSYVRIASDNDSLTGEVSTISVTGDEELVTQTFELTPSNHISPAPLENRTNDVSATIYIEDDRYLFTDAADVAAFTSQAKFKFKGLDINNSSPLVEIHIFSEDDITVDYFINKPQTV
ncbi:hypothetical protein ACIPZ5_03960 [Pseudomonas sp. NPDC089428]|uniref:hypothetical protein n=1 Tax=Pseudomonas sp. NPDC089428 TaxID=3364467 RepID=UPI0037F454A3